MKYESLYANASIPGDDSSCFCSQVKGEMHRYKQQYSLKRHSRGVVFKNLRLIFKKNLVHAKADVLSVWMEEWEEDVWAGGKDGWQPKSKTDDLMKN